MYNLSISSQAKLNTHTRYGSTRPYHSSESEKQNIKENMKKRDREQCDRASAKANWTKKQYENTICINCNILAIVRIVQSNKTYTFNSLSAYFNSINIYMLKIYAN